MAEKKEDPQASPEVKCASRSGETNSRRRLLKLGLGAAPIAMTVASRPVLACHTVPGSIFHSLATNISRAHKVHGTGKDCTYWKSCGISSWPSTCKEYVGTSWRGKKCSAIWGAGCLTGITGTTSSGAAYTCSDNTRCDTLLSLSGGTVLQLAQWCMAAHLNCSANLYSGVITTTHCKNMFLQTKGGGFYEPTAGIKWYHSSTSPASACPPGFQPGCIGYIKATCTA